MTSVYTRAWGLATSAPLLLALPAACELAQHAVEIAAGMYAGSMTPGGARLRLAFGVVKILSILVMMIVALRWWRLGDWGRAARPGLGVLKGIALIVLVQIGGDLLFAAAPAVIARFAVPGVPAARIAASIGGMVVWLFVGTALIPWYVALLTGDRTMTLRRSLNLSRGRMPAAFGTLLLGALPLMIVHYALGYAAFGKAVALVWGLMIVDAGVVALLAASIAAAWFTIYRAAAEASGADKLREDLA